MLILLDLGNGGPYDTNSLITVSIYQPETVYQIYKRVMFNKDVATGKVPASGVGQGSGYSSRGSASVEHIKNEMPPAQGRAECYLWDMFETCTSDQTERMRNGSAITRDYIMIGHVDGVSGEEVYYE